MNCFKNTNDVYKPVYTKVDDVYDDDDQRMMILCMLPCTLKKLLISYYYIIPSYLLSRKK